MRSRPAGGRADPRVKAGLALALVSLFFSFHGLVSLAALAVSFLGLCRTPREDRRALRAACIALLMGGCSFGYAFILLCS